MGSVRFSCCCCHSCNIAWRNPSLSTQYRNALTICDVNLFRSFEFHTVLATKLWAIANRGYLSFKVFLLKCWNRIFEIKWSFFFFFVWWVAGNVYHSICYAGAIIRKILTKIMKEEKFIFILELLIVSINIYFRNQWKTLQTRNCLTLCEISLVL